MKWKKNTPGYSEFCFLTKAVGQGQAYFRRWNERNPQTLLQHLEYIYRTLSCCAVSGATFTTQQCLPGVHRLNSSVF